MQFQEEPNPLVMIVDDHLPNIQTLGTILKKTGYRIVSAENGEQAIDMLKKVVPRLILLDIVMPGVDGLETCKKLKSDPNTRDIPIIFLTAVGESENVLKAFDVGAADYVTKPFNPSILLARVKAHVTLHQQNRKLAMLANQDGLTGISNRRHFSHMLKREWRRAVRNGQALALLMMDIDDFKKYNDFYGHLAGDNVLKSVATALNTSIQRAGDTVARYGGEEFVVILGDTDMSGACRLAEKMLATVRELNIEHAQSSAANIVTASVGAAACYPMGQETPETLIKAADDALYEAKKAGRNCVKFRQIS